MYFRASDFVFLARTNRRVAIWFCICMCIVFPWLLISFYLLNNDSSRQKEIRNHGNVDLEKDGENYWVDKLSNEEASTKSK